MKFLYYNILLIILLSGCGHYIQNTKRNENFIVKYYKKALEYNNKWSEYNMGYIFSGKRFDNIDFNDAVSRCQGPYDTITKVFYKNKDSLEKNIPFKSISYCFDTSKGTTRYYDNEGKVVKIEYPEKTIKYIYTPTEKIERTFDKKTNNLVVEKSIYDKNMKLTKIIKFRNRKQYLSYLFEKKNKNILREYDINGKFTGNYLVIDEF